MMILLAPSYSLVLGARRQGPHVGAHSDNAVQ